jgi:ABC-type glycerol-3-phosphate transport system permease component
MADEQKVKLMRNPRFWATLLLLIPALIQFFPILYMLSISVKTSGDVFTWPPTLIPETFFWQNYPDAMNTAPLLRFLFNSLVAACGIMVVQVVTSVLAAFALARMEFRGKNVILWLILATMMIPGEVTIIPNYLTVASLDWIDTYQALIVPFSASGFGVFLLYQFFRTVPKELEEAAIVDGATPLRFLWQIMIPLSMPAVVSFAVYSFVTAWNQYLWPLIVTQTVEMRTAQIAIGMFRTQNESTSWGMVMAATSILITPSILLFISTQRHFVRGVTMSGLKG